MRFALVTLTMDSRLVGTCIVIAAGALFLGSGESSRRPAAAAVVPADLRGTPPMKGESAPAPKQPRFREATVYVDGQPRGVMRAYELPPSLGTHAMASAVATVDRYYVGEYLAALGVDMARVRALHFYGGARIAVVDGAEARRHATTLSFELSGGDRGKPRMHFPAGIKVNTSVDVVSGIAVYIDKEPPRFVDDGGTGYLAWADGTVVDGVPYAPEEQLKGTRVYVDGALVATLKRKLLPNDLLVNGYGSGGPARFSLAKYLESVGASTKGARAIDLISDDDLVQRIDSNEWKSQKQDFAFTIPAHSQGKLAVDIPRADGLKARISAVQIFARLDPPKRWLAPADFVAMASVGDGPDKDD